MRYLTHTHNRTHTHTSHMNAHTRTYHAQMHTHTAFTLCIHFTHRLLNTKYIYPWSHSTQLHCLTEHTRTHTCKSPNIHTCNTQFSFHLYRHLWTHSHVRHGPVSTANLDCCRQGLLPVLPLLLPVTRHHRGLHREAGRPGTQNKKPNPHSAVGLTSERTAGALKLLSKHEVSRSRGSEFIITLPPLLRTGLS